MKFQLVPFLNHIKVFLIDHIFSNQILILDNSIIGFGFTSDEQLVAFYSYDSYMIINPYDGIYKKKHLH